MWKNKPKSNKSSTLPVTSDGELDYFVSDSICEKEPLKKIFVKQNITVNSNPLNSARNLNPSLLNSSRELQIENGVTSCETEVEQFKKKKRRVRSKTVSISKLTESPTNLSTKMEKCNSDSEICKQRSKSTMDTPVLSTAELSDIVVVVDNSNIFIGARETVSICNPDIRTRHVKLKITQLLQLIEDGRKVTRAMVGASSPSNTTEHVWDIYRRAGYKVDIEERRGRDEQRVDEQLHLAIYKALIELPPQVLVIASGDGHKGKSKSSTSFVQCAKRAIEHGWTVEVLSWKHCLSSEWLKLAATSDRVFVRYLDTHLAKLTAIERRQ